MNSERRYLRCDLVDEEIFCSLVELCRLCGVHAEYIHEMIDEGMIEPVQGCSPLEWRFSFVSVKRVQTTLRLQQDLRVNLPGCALALDLLEDLEELRRRMRHSEDT